MKRVAEGSFENITFKVFRNAENNEFVTKYYVDGKKYEDGDYFTSDKQDAIDTGESEIRFMHKRMNEGAQLNWTEFENGKYAVLHDSEKIRVVLTTYDYTNPQNLYLSPSLDLHIIKDNKRVALDVKKLDWWIEELLPFSLIPYRELFKEEKEKYYSQRGWMWQNGIGKKNSYNVSETKSENDEM